MNRASGRDRQLLVLAGGGHSHALLLRHWAMAPHRRPPQTALVLVSRHSTALYSGMVPGVVAGLYRPDQAAIDLRRLCQRAGVRFLQAEILGLDPGRRLLRLEGRPPLRYDVLSLDVGAVTAAVGRAAEQPVKPLEPFLTWASARTAPAAGAEPLRIRGGGAAAVELALAFRGRGLAVELLLRGEGLHLGSAAARRRGLRLLEEAGVVVHRGAAPQLAADLACTGSRAPAWLAACGLPVDGASGRVLTEASLVVQGHPELFATGDCGLIAAAPRPASGVWAVRAAPLLAENLRRRLQDPHRPLRRWRPQRLALQLLAEPGRLGEPGEPGGRGGPVNPGRAARPPRALATYGPLVWGPSPWLWRWKDRIDRRFMAGFQGPAMGAAMGAVEPMACRGCAAKLPAGPLAAARSRRAAGPGDPAPSPAPAAPAAEDAAVVGTLADGALLLQSVDGFPVLVDDPWLNGRLTTLHACSDLWASGAAVSSAQALVTLPEAAAPLQEELLLQTLAGVRSVLDPLGAALVGGHTLEGRDGAGLALALTVNGTAPPGRHWPKGPLRPGEVLLLTRPIGTGVLFAAAMAGVAPAAWIDGALAGMQADPSALVELLARHGCRACTDITGFGLLGHLGEMLGPAVAVQLLPAAIPAYPGALELLAEGVASSLAPANAAALALLDPGGPVQLDQPASAARLQLLIDPQTCGPLLAALPAASAPAALADLQRHGFTSAALIGRVSRRAAPDPPARPAPAAPAGETAPGSGSSC